MVFCSKCGKQMAFIETRKNRQNGKMMDIYKCIADNIVTAVERV